MLHIAICDDEPGQLAGLEALLREYLRARPSLAGQVTPFSDSCALVEAARERGGFDLYLLDVLLPGMGGIQAGLRLRELGDGGQIIYLTASSEYAVDSYTVGAFFYLLKPVGRETLFQVLDRAVEQQLCRRAEGVVVPTREGPRRLLLEQIYYAERVGRCIRYYCAGKTVDSVTLRTSFREAAAPLLADGRFCLCGASYLFNLQHVAGVEARSAVLDSGVRVPLPRTARAGFQEAWARFWLGEGAR